jgi:4-amino-4-deoxy-L-arabinose transferase-like glycosyltransferase
MRREPSVASAGAKARPAEMTRQALAAVCVLGLLLQLFKVYIAANLAPFGDEAFYWQESRALAWSYTDVPPATALLIRAGESLFGHSPLGMRSLFLLLGALLPLLVWRMARREYGEQAAAWAATGWMLLPLGGTLGVMAMPDVPLTFAALLMLDGLLRAVREERAGWYWLGAGLLLAWLSHYRAALLLPGGLGLLLCSAHGRRLWKQPGLWLALAAGGLGLLPLLLFNRAHGWSGLSFQVVERHPWQFHASGLLQPLEQLLVCTPLIYVLLLWALWRSWRERAVSPAAAVLAWAGGSLVLGYFLFGLFGDDLRFRLHWPLPGYVPALLALGGLFAAGHIGWRWLAAAWALAGLGCACTLVYLWLAASPAQVDLLARYKAFPYNFVGWNEVAARTQALLRERAAAAPLLVADNFLLGAELDFQFDGQVPLWSLDHPRNVKHGRAPQLALWGRDERGLRAAGAGREVLLVVERTTGSERERLAWQQALCTRIANLKHIDSLSLFEGRKVFDWYGGQVPGPDAVPTCAPGGAGGGR